jgi:hypothetical protein
MFLRRSMRVLLACALGACATGTSGGGGGNGGDPVDAAATHYDAQNVTSDAQAVHADAAVPDAYVPPDAPPADSGLFCTDNSQCTNAGECCLTLGGPSGFCAPGTVVLGACVPN